MAQRWLHHIEEISPLRRFSLNQHLVNFQTHNLHFPPDKNPAQQSSLPRNIDGIFVGREMKVY